MSLTAPGLSRSAGVTSPRRRSVAQQTNRHLPVVPRRLFLVELTRSVRTRAGTAGCVAPGLPVAGPGLWLSRPLHLLVELLQDLLALDQHLQPHLLGGVRQDTVETSHLLQLGLLLSVPTLLQLPDHLVQEGDVLLHSRELGSVVVHSEANPQLGCKF